MGAIRAALCTAALRLTPPRGSPTLPRPSGNSNANAFRRNDYFLPFFADGSFHNLGGAEINSACVTGAASSITIGRAHAADAAT
jgi:hypothetical protein